MSRKFPEKNMTQSILKFDSRQINGDKAGIKNYDRGVKMAKSGNVCTTLWDLASALVSPNSRISKIELCTIHRVVGS